jgi:uncharacterized membrane protein (DUF106 family)
MIHRGFKIMLLVFAISIVLASLWNAIPVIKNSVHYALDPTAGRLLSFNPNLGMIIISLFISILISIVQKYTTDQEALRELKKEQKAMQEEMKKYRDNPDKMLEVQKKQMELMPRQFELTMSSSLYTIVPIILFFRWFSDYFTANSSVKLLGFLMASKSFLFPGWVWAYLILSIIFMIILKRLLKLE